MSISFIGDIFLRLIFLTADFMSFDRWWYTVEEPIYFLSIQKKFKTLKILGTLQSSSRRLD